VHAAHCLEDEGSVQHALFKWSASSYFNSDFFSFLLNKVLEKWVQHCKGETLICGTIELYFNLSRIRVFSSTNYQALGTWQKLFEDSFGKQMKLSRRSAYPFLYF
jgi:hypothetical protein